jgi:myo-inositol-1(or 4)-monophosphatase
MLDFAIETAHAAGRLLRARVGQRRTLTFKGDIDIATDADLASEALIVAAIRNSYPDHNIVAEEGGGQRTGSPFTWVIDPIDGTTNYAQGFPYFSVSIALLREGQLWAGVVYDPSQDELFAAQRGEGTRLNGRVQVSSCDRLIDALCSTGFPYDRSTVADNNLAEFSRVLPLAREIRRAGSAALELAYVACGRLDAHWEKRLKPWDSAAGALLVREAGGRVSASGGGDWAPDSPDLLASNGHIHEELARALSAES